jgi:hypothetical protein
MSLWRRPCGVAGMSFPNRTDGRIRSFISILGGRAEGRALRCPGSIVPAPTRELHESAHQRDARGRTERPASCPSVHPADAQRRATDSGTQGWSGSDPSFQARAPAAACAALRVHASGPHMALGTDASRCLVRLRANKVRREQDAGAPFLAARVVREVRAREPDARLVAIAVTDRTS